MNPLILALDLETTAEARKLVNAAGDSAIFYKAGLELYAAAGTDFVREVKSEGCRVFPVAAHAGEGDSPLTLQAGTVITRFDETDLKRMGTRTASPTWWNYACATRRRPASAASGAHHSKLRAFTIPAEMA